jgi:hypothetical protein
MSKPIGQQVPRFLTVEGSATALVYFVIAINVYCLLEAGRDKLLEGSSDVQTPRKKSTQEILTQYKFKGV